MDGGEVEMFFFSNFLGILNPYKYGERTSLFSHFYKKP